PHRQINNDAIVVVWTFGGRVAFGGLKAPDETGIAIRQRVDGIQVRDEVDNLWIVEPREQPADVELRQVIGRRGTGTTSFNEYTSTNITVSSTFMTVVAALYDIHANLPALEAVLDEVRDAGADRIVIGGDVVPGPMPHGTLERLLSVDLPTDFIMGNGDREV